MAVICGKVLHWPLRTMTHGTIAGTGRYRQVLAGTGRYWQLLTVIDCGSYQQFFDYQQLLPVINVISSYQQL
jgi:hypothetical protein